MATYKEQLERARAYNQARKELSFELLRDPDSERVYELRSQVGKNRPAGLRGVWDNPRLKWDLNRNMPWIKNVR